MHPANTAHTAVCSSLTAVNRRTAGLFMLWVLPSFPYCLRTTQTRISPANRPIRGAGSSRLRLGRVTPTPGLTFHQARSCRTTLNPSSSNGAWKWTVIASNSASGVQAASRRACVDFPAAIFPHRKYSVACSPFMTRSSPGSRSSTRTVRRSPFAVRCLQARRPGRSPGSVVPGRGRACPRRQNSHCLQIIQSGPSSVRHIPCSEFQFRPT